MWERQCQERRVQRGGQQEHQRLTAHVLAGNKIPEALAFALNRPADGDRVGHGARPSPSTESPSPSPVASGGSASSLLWLWILLGTVVIVGVTVWLARRSGKRSAMATSWRSKVVDASAKGSALIDMMSMAESPGARAAEDASARWAEIQRRMDDLAQELYALLETAPGEAERERVADVLASLQAVRSAMDAERAPGEAGPEQGARVHDLLLTFEASLRALRSPGEDGARI